MASVREIAKQLGVSAATVSRAMNNHPLVAEDVRQRVIVAMNRSRYVPTVGRRETMNIAFAYTGVASIGSPFDAALMQGMSDRMEQCGFDLMVLDLRRAMLPRENYTQMFLRKGIRAAVLRTTADTMDICRQIAAEGFPALVVGYHFDEPEVNYIYSNSYAGSCEAMSHLVDLGHTRIAISLHVVDDSDHTDRLNAWQYVMKQNKLAVPDKFVIRAPASLEGGAQLVRRIAGMVPRPTAVYIADPLVAVGAIAEARQMGWDIPRDLSIVGFDDSELRYMVYPKLTAVCQDARAVGQEAFELINRLLGVSGDEATETVFRRTLATHFEVNGSTAPPGKSSL